MGFLNSIFAGGKKNTPQPSIRDTLFGDMSLDQYTASVISNDEFPWSAFLSARNHIQSNQIAPAILALKEVLTRPNLEPRHYAQAWHFLKQYGEPVPVEVSKQLFGTVVEVAMPEGLDVLAAYPNYTARYYNHSGSGIVWEAPDNSLNPLIDQLLSLSKQVVELIGPWDKPRPTDLPTGHLRMSFLTPSGLHFGQGPIETLSSNPMAGPVFSAATQLMQALVEKSTKKK